jgi:1-acyl-sn-glycerol-3-phosphate acyltransferase
MPFKKGFAHFAIKAGVPVIPVALSGTKDLWFRKQVRVIIGKPIPPEGHTPESLTDTAFQTIKDLLPEYREPAGRKLLRRQLTRLF